MTVEKRLKGSETAVCYCHGGLLSCVCPSRRMCNPKHALHCQPWPLGENVVSGSVPQVQQGYHFRGVLTKVIDMCGDRDSIGTLPSAPFFSEVEPALKREVYFFKVTVSIGSKQ